MNKTRIYGVLVVAAILLSLASFAYVYHFSSSAVVYLSTTTSFDATGFLSFLNEHLKAHYSYEIRRIAIGTGMALVYADRGDVDACIVHAPSLEREFRLNGTFSERKVLAYNFFIVVGPEEDPAGVREAKNAIEAFYKIYLYAQEHPDQRVFVSRYDNSGTHVKEKYLRDLTIEEYNLSVTYEEISSEPRYVKAGAGMAETLMMADQMQAYTLVDTGTRTVMSPQLHLKKLFAGDYYTLNVYSIMVVKDPKHKEAFELADFLASSQGQRLFEGYVINGQRVFYPARPLLEAYREGSLQPGTYNFVPPDLRNICDDLTLAKRIFEYAFRDLDGDGNPDRESGR